MAFIRITHWTKPGSTLRDARTQRRWSQQELAERAHVSRSWLARVEGGHRGAELEPLLRLFDALDLVWTLGEGTPIEARTPTPATGSPAEQGNHSAAVKRAEAAASRAASWDRPQPSSHTTLAERQHR